MNNYDPNSLDHFKFLTNELCNTEVLRSLANGKNNDDKNMGTYYSISHKNFCNKNDLSPRKKNITLLPKLGNFQNTFNVNNNKDKSDQFSNQNLQGYKTVQQEKDTFKKTKGVGQFSSIKKMSQLKNQLNPINNSSASSNHQQQQMKKTKMGKSMSQTNNKMIVDSKNIETNYNDINKSNEPMYKKPTLETFPDDVDVNVNNKKNKKSLKDIRTATVDHKMNMRNKQNIDPEGNTNRISIRSTTHLEHTNVEFKDVFFW